MNKSRHPGKLVTGTVLVIALGSLTGPPALAGVSDQPLPEERWATVDDLGFPEPNESEKNESIRVFEYHPPIVYDYNRAVTGVEAIEEDGSDQVITLATDILFQPDRWELSDSVPQRLEALLQEVPKESRVTVEGHTDSIVGEIDNQELSENRARAVADVIEEVRPDLDSQVEGYADTRPKQKESDSDDNARRANRRVEIRYEN